MVVGGRVEWWSGEGGVDLWEEESERPHFMDISFNFTMKRHNDGIETNETNTTTIYN